MGWSCKWLAALAVGAWGMTTALAGGRGDKIQFSQPNSPVVSSNLAAPANPGLDQLNPTPGGFKQVQEDLFRPLKDAMPPVDSMQGVTSLPAPPAPQRRPQLSKHARELIERRRNWAFTDMNDLDPQPTLEESLGLKDTGLEGKDKTSTSLIQRYYERQKPAPRRDQPQPGETLGARKQDFTGAIPFDPLTSQIPGKEKVSFGKDIFAPNQDSINSDNLSGTFTGTGKFSSYSAEELAAQKHRQEFSHLLDPTLPASKAAGNNFIVNDANHLYGRNAILGKDDHATPATQPAQAVAKPYRSAIYPIGLPDSSTTLHSSVFDDPTAVALGMPNPVQVKTTPPPITAEAVQKMLDPFSANMAKRKF